FHRFELDEKKRQAVLSAATALNAKRNSPNSTARASFSAPRSAGAIFSGRPDFFSAPPRLRRLSVHCPLFSSDRISRCTSRVTLPVRVTRSGPECYHVGRSVSTGVPIHRGCDSCPYRVIGRT